MSEQYIVIPNWDEYQHYKGKERPRWIKLYPALLHDDQYLKLTIGQKATLFGIWLVYASSGCRVAVDTASLTRQLGHRVTSQTLEALNHAGFIEFSSRDGLETLYTQENREEKRREPPSIPPSPNPLLEFEQAERKERNGKSGYIENLSSYTGCRIVRGEVGISHVYDPLGTEPKPAGWPHETPSRQEIAKELKARGVAKTS